MGIQALEFSVGSRSENAINGMLAGAENVRTRSDANVETGEPRDLVSFWNVFHFTEYIHVHIRPVEERPDLRFRHCDLLSTQEILGIELAPWGYESQRHCA